MAALPPLPKKGRSGFGKQCDSRKSTAPTAYMHGSTRDHWEHVYINKASESVLMARTSPGAIYNLPSTIGRQPLSDCATAPAATWTGKGERPVNAPAKPSSVPGPIYVSPSAFGRQVASSKATAPTALLRTTEDRGKAAGVGPGALRRYTGKEYLASCLLCDSPNHVYAVPSGVGCKQALSTARGSQAAVFTTGPRLHSEQLRESSTKPGPGAHDSWTGMGKQIKSGFITMPAPTFGAARETYQKVYMDKAFEENLKGTASPSNYGCQSRCVTSGFGKMVHSRKRTGPVAGFGYGGKTAVNRYPNDNPGPGAYD